MNNIFQQLTGDPSIQKKERIWFYQYQQGIETKMRKCSLGWYDGKDTYHSSFRDAKESMKFYGAKVWSELI